MPVLPIVTAIGCDGRAKTGSELDSPSSRVPHEISGLERPSLTDLQARTDAFYLDRVQGGHEGHHAAHAAARSMERLGAMQTDAVVLLDDDRCQELDAFLVERICEFNSNATGYFDGRLLGASVQNEAGEVIAGLSGHTWGGCAEISHLWVSEHHRGHGLGKTLLHAAEAEAVRRGCTQVVLTTHSFQAPGFYRRLGYERKYVIEGRPKGHSNIVFVKSLEGEDGT